MKRRIIFSLVAYLAIFAAGAFFGAVIRYNIAQVKMKLEIYKPVCGEPYACDIAGCTHKATWRCNLTNTNSILLCDEHAKEKEENND